LIAANRRNAGWQRVLTAGDPRNQAGRGTAITCDAAPMSDRPTTQYDHAAKAQSEHIEGQKHDGWRPSCPRGMSAQRKPCAGLMSVEECVATMQYRRISALRSGLKSKSDRRVGKIGCGHHQLKPDRERQGELRKAEEQARSDVRSHSG